MITAPCRKLSIHPSPAATNDAAENTEHMSSFSDLGLSELIADNLHNLGIRTPRRVQQHCIPKVLEGRHVIGIDESGSGKSTAFALSILQRLAENPFAAFALVLTPTRDFAFELMNQFFALGHPFRLRVAAIVGGFDIRSQAKHLLTRPHIVIATPGRINVLLQNNPQIADMFAATKFLVLDQADQLLDNFNEDLKSIFQYLPKKRQNLLFSANMTTNMQKLCDTYQEKPYAFQAYEGRV